MHESSQRNCLGSLTSLYENQRNGRFKIQPFQSPTTPPSLPEHEGGQQHGLQEFEGQVCLTTMERGLLRERARLLVSMMQKKKKAKISFLSFCWLPLLQVSSSEAPTCKELCWSRQSQQGASSQPYSLVRTQGMKAVWTSINQKRSSWGCLAEWPHFPFSEP